MQEELTEAKGKTELFAHKQAAAEEAPTAPATADVLMTVLFASVLFFAGIGGTFDSPRLAYWSSSLPSRSSPAR